MKKFINIFLISIFSMQLLAGDAATEVIGQTAGSAAAGAAAGAASNAAMTEVAKNSGVFQQWREKAGKFLESPLGVGIVGSIGLVNSLTLRSAAEDQVRDSEANIKKIEKLMAEFKDSFSNDCLAGRENVAVPQCYCFLDNGSKNSNRTNSKVCQDLWASQDYKIALSAGNYSNNGELLADVKGCVALNGKFDEGCKCKKMLDSKGSNACQKVSSLGAINPSLGVGFVKSSSLPQMTDAINQLAQGNVSMRNLDGKNMAIAFKKAADMNNKIYDAAAKGGGKFPLSVDEVQKMQDQMFSKKSMQALNSAFGSKSMTDISPPANSNLAKAINAVAIKTGLETSGTGKGLQKKSDAKEALNFNFNDSANANSGGNNVEFMEKKYNFKNNDISKDTGASIFEIISHRYIESGLNKLFDDKEEPTK
jgi:hypothetical protein